MELKLTPWDAASQLMTREDAVRFLHACLEEAPDDLHFIVLALDAVRRSAAFHHFHDDEPLRSEILRPASEPGYSAHGVRLLASQLGIELPLKQAG